MILSEAMELKWGTYGKDREHALRWITLGECSNEHLQNILRISYYNVGWEKRDAIAMILNHRLSVDWKLNVGDQVYHNDYHAHPEGPGVGIIVGQVKYSQLEPDALLTEPYMDHPAYLIVWHGTNERVATKHEDFPHWPAYNGFETESALILVTDAPEPELELVLNKYGQMVCPEPTTLGCRVCNNPGCGGCYGYPG